MQKRIVVLGGVGFIGSHLCLRLLNEGNQVFCVDIRDAVNAPLLRELQHPAFRYVHHNITLPFSIRCEQIYNLAAPSMVRYNKALPVETLKACMVGSVHALETAKAERARVVYASSGEVYGINLRDTSLEESNGCTTHRMLYEGKRAAEMLHRAYQSEYGVDCRVARICNTYGSGAELMDQRVVIKMILAALQNRDIPINGSGEQMRTFCWVDDIVDGLVRLMEAETTESTRTLNLGSNHEVSIRKLAEKIIELTGSKSQIVHTEARIDDIRRRMPEISAAERELGWTPTTPLTEGLRRTIAYIEKELTDKAYAGLSWVEVNS